MITRIVEQIKMIEIKQPSYFVDGGMGFCGNWVKEHIYYSTLCAVCQYFFENFFLENLK